MVNMFYDTNPVQHFAKIETWALEAFPAKTPTANSRSPVERQSCQWEQYHDGSMTVWSNLSFLVSSAAAQSWSQNLSNLKVETTIQYTINIGFLCLNMFCSFYLLIITDWIHVYIYIYTYVYHVYILSFLHMEPYIPPTPATVDNHQVVSPPSAPSFQAFSMQPPLSVSPRARVWYGLLRYDRCELVKLLVHDCKT